MQWMVMSLGNGRCWNGSFIRYLRIEDVIAALHEEVSRTDGFTGSFFDYFLVAESYAEMMKDAIREALRRDELDDATAADLSTLYEVFRGGKVIMG